MRAVEALRAEPPVAYFSMEIALRGEMPTYSGGLGMKAAHNGVLNFSVLDGWWAEGCEEGVTGWAIGPAPDEPVSPDERARREVEDLYGKLEFVVLPTYYQRPSEWARMMRESIDDVASWFNSHRMLRRYVTDAYFRRGDLDGP